MAQLRQRVRLEQFNHKDVFELAHQASNHPTGALSALKRAHTRISHARCGVGVPQYQQIRATSE
jgi:hypothetical protein